MNMRCGSKISECPILFAEGRDHPVPNFKDRLVVKVHAVWHESAALQGILKSYFCKKYEFTRDSFKCPSFPQGAKFLVGPHEKGTLRVGTC